MTREFRQAPDCEVNFGGVTGVMRIARNDAPYIITVEEADLDVTQARALRDWLNSVLPAEPSAEPIPPGFRALSDVIAEHEKDPVRKAALDKARASLNRTAPHD